MHFSYCLLSISIPSLSQSLDCPSNQLSVSFSINYQKGLHNFPGEIIKILTFPMQLLETKKFLPPE